MAIFRSLGAVQALTPQPMTWSQPSSVALYGNASTYLTLWKTQPNVRKCVDFLARNAAQLGTHVFRRVSDTDRVRLYDHGLARSLANPNPSTTRYRLIEALMQDMGIYFNAYWLKVRVDDGDRIGLVRLPPEQVSVSGVLSTTGYVWRPDGAREQRFAPDQIVRFSGYENGVSPLETLRRTLAEEIAAGEYREHFWNNAARLDGVLSRPATAPSWTPDQRRDFRASWELQHTLPENSGKTAILEDGMTWVQTGSNFRDAEYSAARKLTAEECGSAYHIPLPMIGILEHATFSNIREQHKQLYADCLGPWLVMIEEELERQLLPDFEDRRNIYVEFNIREKLKGTFDEEATSLRTLVGRPLMSVNEGRARMNLPATDDPNDDTVALPLNMNNPGGNPETTDNDPDARPEDAATGGEDRAPVDAVAWHTTIRAFWVRQRHRIQKDPPEDRAARFTAPRWNAELATALAPVVGVRRAMHAALAINYQTYLLLRALRPAFGSDRPVPSVEQLR